MKHKYSLLLSTLAFATNAGAEPPATTTVSEDPGLEVLWQAFVKVDEVEYSGPPPYEISPGGTIGRIPYSPGRGARFLIDNAHMSSTGANAIVPMISDAVRDEIAIRRQRTRELCMQNAVPTRSKEALAEYLKKEQHRDWKQRRLLAAEVLTALRPADAEAFQRWALSSSFRASVRVPVNVAEWLLAHGAEPKEIVGRMCGWTQPLV